MNAFTSSRSPRNEGLGSHFFGKRLEVHLVLGLCQSIWIVQDDDAVAHRNPPEVNGRSLGPFPLSLLGRRVVAEHQDVQVVHGHALCDRAPSLEIAQVGLARGVASLRNSPRSSLHMLIWVVGKVSDADHPSFVAPLCRGDTKPSCCVSRFLGRNIVDDKRKSQRIPLLVSLVVSDRMARPRCLP